MREIQANELTHALKSARIDELSMRIFGPKKVLMTLGGNQDINNDVATDMAIALCIFANSDVAAADIRKTCMELIWV